MLHCDVTDQRDVTRPTHSAHHVTPRGRSERGRERGGWAELRMRYSGPPAWPPLPPSPAAAWGAPRGAGLSAKGARFSIKRGVATRDW